MSVLDDLLEGRRPPPGPRLAPADAFRNVTVPNVRDGFGGVAVGMSPDLERVLALPRRHPLAVDRPEDPETKAVVESMTRLLSRVNPHCTCQARHRRPCLRVLKPAQAWALKELSEVSGLLGPIGVGHGKTGIGILAPLVVPGTKVAVLLIPPNLRDQLAREYDLWSQHFQTPSIVFDHHEGVIRPGRPVLHVVPYSRFSRPESTTLLDGLRPDLIIADEAHKLRDRRTATSGRVIRYMTTSEARREADGGAPTRFAAWSGTVTKGSVTDYTHLAAFALREGSPVPLDPGTGQVWASALDPIPNRAPYGALARLGNEPVPDAFARRLRETRGWVATREASVATGLVLRERKAPKMPEGLAKALAKMRGTWTRPDGEELVDVLQVAKSARELALGFFYRWRFPRGEPEEMILRWFAARKAWHRELRLKLEHPEEHLDSPFLCENAAARALDGYRGPLPVWRTATFAAWRTVRALVQPVPDTVWLDDPPEGFEAIPDADYLVRDAADWLRHHRGIVWYEHEAFGARLAEVTRLPRHAGGLDAEARILAEDGSRSLIASLKAHGTGRDGLQRLFAKQLFVPLPSSGDACEQNLGRLHRIGQDADEVETWAYRHVPEFRDGIDKAFAEARYIETTIGTRQKLLAATVEWADDD